MFSGEPGERAAQSPSQALATREGGTSLAKPLWGFAGGCGPAGRNWTLIIFLLSAPQRFRTIFSPKETAMRHCF